MDTVIVIGLGEVGSALYSVLFPEHKVGGVDITGNRGLFTGEVDFMHVCLPYSGAFVDQVREYAAEYSPSYTVIHSTVPVGTSKACNATHSPVMGVHPNLERSLRTFTKFVGGPDASIVARHLMAAGIRCYVTPQRETTELMKLLSTTFYGLCIEWTKHVGEMCEASGVPYEAWTLWTQAYNQGYAAMGRAEYTRPQLVPLGGRIGGHCVMPNLELQPDDDFTKLIRERNQ